MKSTLDFAISSPTVVNWSASALERVVGSITRFFSGNEPVFLPRETSGNRAQAGRRLDHSYRRYRLLPFFIQ